MNALQMELLDALRSTEGRALLREVFVGAAREAAVYMRTMPDPDELLSIPDAANLRGCSVAAMYKVVQRGSVPVVRMGRSVRVRRRHVAGDVASS